MTTQHPVILGLDVGGSAVKAGLVAADGEILVPHLRSARRPTTFDELVGIVRELADEMCTQRGAKRPCDLATGVGLGVPGLLDDDHGGVERSPNLPWLDGRPLRAALAETLGVAFDSTQAAGYKPRYNIAPTDPHWTSWSSVSKAICSPQSKTSSA